MIVSKLTYIVFFAGTAAVAAMAAYRLVNLYQSRSKAYCGCAGKSRVHAG